MTVVSHLFSHGKQRKSQLKQLQKQVIDTPRKALTYCKLGQPSTIILWTCKKLFVVLILDRGWSHAVAIWLALALRVSSNITHIWQDIGQEPSQLCEEMGLWLRDVVSKAQCKWRAAVWKASGTGGIWSTERTYLWHPWNVNGMRWHDIVRKHPLLNYNCSGCSPFQKQMHFSGPHYGFGQFIATNCRHHSKTVENPPNLAMALNLI